MAWCEAFDRVYKPATDDDKDARQIASSAGNAVVVAALPDAMYWTQAGRACHRFALQATALGLKHAFINQPVEVARRRPELVMRFGPSGM